MATEIQFGLLGPLMVRRSGVVVPLPPGKQRTVLAALLLDVGHVVSLGELAEVLWGTSPPSSARVTTQNYVMRLRKTLGRTGSRISTQPRGYLIHADASELDVSRFQAHLDAAGAAAGHRSWQTAAAEARSGLALWRGEALADVESELLAIRDAPRLEELRMRTLEIRVDADLHLARHGEVITELRQLAGANPLRERLHSMLMLALYRDGRQAEALVAYQHVRDVLVEELGIEPGPDLQNLHRQILSADSALAITGPAPLADAEPPWTVPQELPLAVPGFTGRSAELQALTELLDRSSAQGGGAIVISAIGGTAGVGKTALAVHWAHQVADRFPDGQLYVNLRGYDPGPPVPAADALAGFLRSLRMPGQDIPPEEDRRAARYRSLLAGKRILVVLDNAGSAGQVRPLLPASPSCAVVVTSRDALAGLVARDGAARLDLDVLPQADAVALLRTLIGARTAAEPEAVAELAGQCCRLPLALRVAAELTVSRPDMSLPALAAELADLRTRLDLLDAGGDPGTQVRVVFSWSCRHLSTDAAQAFRLLGLHPGPDLDPYAAAALAGTTMAQARRVLEILARAHLIQPAGPGRYGMHDLLRGYARELSAATDPREDQHAALTRLFDYYLHTAAAAMDTLYPADRHRRPSIKAPAGVPGPQVDAAGRARAWLDAQRANLVAVTVDAAEHDWPGHAARLAAILARYLEAGGHNPEAVTVHTRALAAARQVGDRACEAAALVSLGHADTQRGRYEQAVSYLEQALALCRQAGDRVGQARAHTNLGIASFELGRYQQAAGHHRQALALHRRSGDLTGQARALNNLGVTAERLGDLSQAIGHFQQSLTLHRQASNRTGEATPLSNLGRAYRAQGRWQQALEHTQRSLMLCRDTGNRVGEAYALAYLGDIYLTLDRHDQAMGHHQQALAIFRQTGDLPGQVRALNSIGEALRAAGQPARARAEHAAALRLTSQTGDKYEQARAHNDLAHCFHRAGDPDRARRHWQQALTLYAELGVPEAGQVRAQLSAAGHPLAQP